MSRATHAGWRLALLAVALVLPACQQRMAKQPYYRPLDYSPFFEDGRASRPLEPGVVSRDQILDSNPVVTGYKAEVRRAIAKLPNGAAGVLAIAPPTDGTKPPPGVPNDVANYTDEFPFELTQEDLKRGGTRYAVFCTPCHGPLGNGGGKIVERGYLRPPSFHLRQVDAGHEPIYPGDAGYTTGDANGLPRGYSRGFDRWGKRVSLTTEAGKDGSVPVGYFYEVITQGYGGMPSYNEQIPPADRWRIIAYIRALQLSQGGQISADEAKKLQEHAPHKGPEHGSGGHK